MHLSTTECTYKPERFDSQRMEKFHNMQQSEASKSVRMWARVLSLVTNVCVCVCLCWNVYGSANNSCQQKLCSHLCLPKRGYPGFTCACPNSNDRVRYALDSRRLQCTVTHLPAPGTVSSIKTRCHLRTAVESRAHAHFTCCWQWLYCWVVLVLSVHLPSDPLCLIPVFQFYREIAQVFLWKFDANENSNWSFFLKIRWIRDCVW